ncbi:MAG TPA: class F sortase, partial [Thermomicrobiaceae bacterium]|nr:class F sortase [Thermomicrobiaceae bacterium]
NTMQAPSGWWDVGWYKLGYQPGQIGNAVIAGHLDSYTGPAVFWNLKDLVPGDIVSVVDANGQTLHFRVTGMQSYRDADAPIAAIFGPSDGRHLNLITCAGVWDSSTGAYTKRLVVFTDLVTQ